jgi:hypothetical protein
MFLVASRKRQTIVAVVFAPVSRFHKRDKEVRRIERKKFAAKEELIH